MIDQHSFKPAKAANPATRTNVDKPGRLYGPKPDTQDIPRSLTYVLLLQLR